MSLRRIISIASVLTKSQLRAGRSGRAGEGLFRNPRVLLVIDAAVFAACSALGFAAVSALSLVPTAVRLQMVLAVREGIVFIPALVPSMILVAGLLFELSVSSKFASSDSVNWLPVSQLEYVAASAISVSYNYSVIPAAVLGLTAYPAYAFGFGTGWVGVAALSVVTLFMGGVLVEILRAAVNRVSSAVMKRARRGALVLRMVVTVAIILAFEVIFNFVFIIDVLNAFTNSLPATEFVPLFWASLAAKAIMEANPIEAVGYTLATVIFTLAMLWIAIKVRSRYWAPSPLSAPVMGSEYHPRAGALSRLGLNAAEAAIVRKDVRAISRRRELLPYFAVPVVITVVIFLQARANPAAGGGQSPSAAVPVWLVGGIFALLISSIGFGQEGRSVTVLYSSPVSPREIFRAKAFTALTLSVVVTAAVFVLVSLVTGTDPKAFIEGLLVSAAVAVEGVFIGMTFGARYPDFQERPRPRFVEPLAMILMMLVGMGTMVATAVPVIVMEAVPAGANAASPYSYLIFASLAFATAISALFYRLAKSGVEELFSEYRE